MTVTTTSNRNDHIGDDSTTLFAFTFAIQQSTDMTVYFDGVVQLSGYVVSINSSGVGGTVSFSVAPSDDVKVSLIREVDYTQETSLPTETNIPEATLENAYDKNTMLAQQLKEITDRCLKLSVDTIGVDTDLPNPTDYPGYLLVANDDGDGFELKSANEIFNEMEGGGYGDMLGPATSTVVGGIVLFDSLDGTQTKQLGLGAADQVVKMNSLGTAFEVGAVSAGGAGWNARLSLESGVLISTSDQLAKTTLYVVGGRVPTNSSGTIGSAKISGGQISKSLTGVVTSKGVDVYIRIASGSDYDTVEFVDWTNTTTQATTPSYNAEADAYFHPTNTAWLWVGCFIPSASGQCEVSSKLCSLWNYGKRTLHFLNSIEGTNSWTYGTNTWRAVNGGSTLGTAKVRLMNGLVRDPIFALANLVTSYVAAYESARTGIGLSSSANFAQLLGQASPYDGNYKGSAWAAGFTNPALGSNDVWQLEAVPAGASVTIYGDNGTPGTTKLQSGLVVGHYY